MKILSRGILLIIMAFLFLTSCGMPKTGGEGALSRGMEDGSGSGLYPAWTNYLGEPQWGYIGNSGKFELPSVYSSARRFQRNGLAVAGKNGLEGLINSSGKFIAEPVYQSIDDFSDGLAVATDEKGFVVLDGGGNIISERYPYISAYREGRAVYYTQASDGKILYGYLGEDGKPAIEAAYASAGDFDGGLAVVSISDNLYAIIDRSGKRIKTLKYNYVMNISDGMIPFSPAQDGKYGYLDAKGNVAIEPAFSAAEAFSEGTAVVNASLDYTQNKMGLIDKKGKFLINPQYNDIVKLGEGMAAVGLPVDPNNIFAGSKYALATVDGKLLTDFKFFSVGGFRNGVASAYDNACTFFIDKQGNRIESLPCVEGIGTLELLDGLVYADIDKRPYYMDRKGEIVYRPSSTITVGGGAKVSEERFRPNRNYLVYYPVLSGLKDLKVQESINLKLKDMWIDKTIKPTDNLDYEYEGGFVVGFNRKDLLELEKSAYDYPFGMAHGTPVKEYAHVDKRTGAFYELKDLFKDGSDYTKVLGAIVKKQIGEHGEEMGVWPDSYKGIRPDQPFYLSGDALMLYFEPYEIAPYAAGFPTFAIPFAEISEIINKQGSFWRSFN